MEINKLLLIIAVIGVYLIICPVLFAQDNIYPYFIQNSQPDSESYHNIDFRYSNLYRKRATNEPDGFADILSYKTGSSIQIGKHYFYVSYTKDRFTARINALKNEADLLEFITQKEQLALSGKWQLPGHQITGSIFLSESPGLYLEQKNTGMTQFGTGLGISMGSADVNYNVNGIDGNIPFNWYKLDANCFLRKAGNKINLRYSSTIPAKPENKFDNKLFANDFSLALTQRINSKISFYGSANYTHNYAELFYDKTQYAKLDNLHSFYSNLSMTYRQKQELSYSLGCKTYFSRIGDDSYIDIWPFTYWDMFMAHRTRIKAADINSILPYFSVSYDKNVRLGNSHLKLNATLEYDQLFHNADIIVKNRRVVLYPFLFAYDTDYYDLETDIDGFFVLPLQLSIQKWGVEAGIAFEQLIPVDWGYFTKSHPALEPSDGKKTHESGGTDFRFYFSLPTPNLSF